jgi:hypothetical protein
MDEDPHQRIRAALFGGALKRRKSFKTRSVLQLAEGLRVRSNAVLLLDPVFHRQQHGTAGLVGRGLT